MTRADVIRYLDAGATPAQIASYGDLRELVKHQERQWLHYLQARKALK